MVVWSKLSKADKKHLRENKILYKWQFEKQVLHMKKMLKEYPNDRTNFCWKCRKIADKLGIWKE